MGVRTWIEEWPVYRQLTGSDPLGRGVAARSPSIDAKRARTSDADQVTKSICPFCAVGCGLAHTFRQFEVMRFLLGVAESGVFPATLVLLANWFPRSERARANAYWILCQPLALVAASPFTS